jgi:hypothetical protein
MLKSEGDIYGLMAEFEQPERLVEAVRRAREAGYRRVDAYTPFPLDDLEESLELGPTLVPPIVLLGGLAGGAGAYAMMWFACVIHYPLNVGGRPLNSWPMFVPIMFEMTVLFAAFAAVGAVLVLNRLPMPYHPVYHVPDFERASRDRFFICIEAEDARFDRRRTREFLETLEPRLVVEVPTRMPQL